MTEILLGALTGFDWFVLCYFLVLNTTYLFLIVVAAFEFGHVLRRRAFSGYDQVFASPLTPPVSVLVPAHDEEAGIVDSVRAMLALRYPLFEVVVIEDGSTDGTFEVLRQTFGLVPVPWVPARDVPVRGEIISVHVPGSGEPLTVVRKSSAGNKTDALNAGINAARYPLLCMVDADAVLDTDALLRVAKPFIDDPARVVATGGVVRAANGCIIDRGSLLAVRMPQRWLERIQVMEYMRAFLLGRAGFSRLGALVVISGAFGLFRRDVVVGVGGLDPDTLGEDAELVVRIHRAMREAGRAYRIVFVAEPVCWTEVPATIAVLSRQRKRWSRGLSEILLKHRRLIGNPRYGRIGLAALPYYLVFEVISPFIELFGVLAVVVGFAVGAVDLSFAVLFLLVAVGYGTFLSVCALTIEEYSFHRYPSWRDLGIGFLAAVFENLGYRQLHSWWRIRGVVAAVRNRPAEWGAMTRGGLSSRPAGVAEAPAGAAVPSGAGEEVAQPSSTVVRRGGEDEVVR